MPSRCPAGREEEEHPARTHADQPVLRGLHPHAGRPSSSPASGSAPTHEHVGRLLLHQDGETLIDTAMTQNAMRPDIIVVRHHAAGAVHLLARKVDCSVVNAGDGAHEHPTQGAARRPHHPPQQRAASTASSSPSAATSCIRAWRAPTSSSSTRSAPVCASSAPRRCCRRASSAWASRCSPTCAGARRRRHRHDAAPPARADERLLRAVREEYIRYFGLDAENCPSPRPPRW